MELWYWLFLFIAPGQGCQKASVYDYLTAKPGSNKNAGLVEAILEDIPRYPRHVHTDVRLKAYIGSKIRQLPGDYLQSAGKRPIMCRQN